MKSNRAETKIVRDRQIEWIKERAQTARLVTSFYLSPEVAAFTEEFFPGAKDYDPAIKAMRRILNCLEKDGLCRSSWGGTGRGGIEFNVRRYKHWDFGPAYNAVSGKP